MIEITRRASFAREKVATDALTPGYADTLDRLALEELSQVSAVVAEELGRPDKDKKYNREQLNRLERTQKKAQELVDTAGAELLLPPEDKTLPTLRSLYQFIIRLPWNKYVVRDINATRNRLLTHINRIALEKNRRVLLTLQDRLTADDDGGIRERMTQDVYGVANKTEYLKLLLELITERPAQLSP